MTLTYVLRSMRRRKVRAALMILALIVGVGTLTALNATVDSYRRYFAGTVAGEVGAFDLTLSRKDTEPNPYLDFERLAPLIDSVEGVAAVAGRIHGVVSVKRGDKSGDVLMVALDPRRDRFGAMEVITGTRDLGVGADGLPGAIVLKQTADTFDLAPGDRLEIQYAAPVSRLAGQPADSTASRRRTTASWVVRGIATQRGITGLPGNEGLIVDLAVAQERFGVGQNVERILVGFDPAIYQNNDPQKSAFRARQLAVDVATVIDPIEPGIAYQMPRPRAVLVGANAFIFFQSLISLYGLLSLSVVGLLIHTLIMTNVQEQTRDLAVLRIVGAPRSTLFNLVMAEVAVVGAIGVVGGILAGQAVNNWIIVPLIEKRSAGLGANLPLVSPNAVLSAVLTAGVVLSLSALAPARKAAGTKVTHAINPGVAEGLGLDELAAMREERVNLRIPGLGAIILVYPLLLFFAFPLAFDFGVLWMMALLIFAALAAMIVGAAMVFYLVILPMERLLLWVIEHGNGRVGYFVRRTALRGRGRNTLIALMIVMSATLPSFLSTSLALQAANAATDRRLSGGAPFVISPPRQLEDGRGRRTVPLKERGFEQRLLDLLLAEPAFAHVAVRSLPFPTTVRDGVGLRDARAQVYGAEGSLAGVLYPEAVDFEAGDISSLERISREPGTAIIGAALANHFDRRVGDQLLLDGEGRDHSESVRIVAIAKRLGGLGTYSAKQTTIWSGENSILVGMETFRRLVHDPRLGPPDPNARLVQAVLAAPTPGQDELRLSSELRLKYGTEHGLLIDSTAETVRSAQEEARTGQLFLIVLTTLSSVLAIFGVFAVIYVSVYGRRGEIGMLKAVGSSGRYLLAVFVAEAMVMTLSATLTGVTSGVVLAYALRLSEGFRTETPTVLAIDPIVIVIMLVLMILASLVSATLATHSYRRRRAVEILASL